MTTNPTNNPKLAGQIAGPKYSHGEYSRYATYPVHTRFDQIQWFTADAFDMDEIGMPRVIRQCDTFEEALAI